MTFYDNLEAYENRLAIINENGTNLTYKELSVRCDAFSDAFETGKSLVFCFCKNETASLIAYLSCLRSGNVPLLLNRDIDIELAMCLINVYKPKYLFNADEIVLEKYFHKIVYQCDNAFLVDLEFETGEMHQELALLLTTSGSTGSPKLVKQSYINIQSNAQAIAEYLELGQDERPITTLPMNYTYGLSIINSHLLVGACLALTNRSIIERQFWNLCHEQKITSFGGVPYTYEILKKIKFFKMELPFLKTMTQAGGKLSSGLHQEFAEYAYQNGKKFIVMYGQTEATARMAYLPYEKAIEKNGSMGIAIPGGLLWLKDENGDKIEKPDIVGELIYEGDNVTLGYAECLEDLSKGDERQGILETGDMARMDAEGYFYIVGRKKRFLKIYGNRVNLDEMEMMIKKKFGLSDVACSGVDDRLYVFIDEKKADADFIKKYLSEKTSLNSNAFTIRMISEIPKNDSGKTLYIKLEDFYD